MCAIRSVPSNADKKLFAMSRADKLGKSLRASTERCFMELFDMSKFVRAFRPRNVPKDTTITLFESDIVHPDDCCSVGEF